MLLALLYHRIGNGRLYNEYAVLRDHLAHIADRYHIVLPGEPLPPRQCSLCLTFDDASYDFYHYIFPLLKKYNLRALLAVPVKYINEKASADTATRLAVPHYEAMNDGIYQEKDPFCSWEELEEMVSTPHVSIASHSYSHANVALPDVDIEKELVFSKEVLEKRLGQKVTTFVYPLGRTSKAAHNAVTKHYDRGMRIGGAANKDWSNGNDLLYRICCDDMPHHLHPFRRRNRLRYIMKYLANTIR